MTLSCLYRHCFTKYVKQVEQTVTNLHISYTSTQTRSQTSVSDTRKQGDIEPKNHSSPTNPLFLLQDTAMFSFQPIPNQRDLFNPNQETYKNLARIEFQESNGSEIKSGNVLEQDNQIDSSDFEYENMLAIMQSCWESAR